MTSESNERAVRELAYAKWELAGHPGGDGIQFWLQAEREICEESPTAAETPEPLKLAKASSGSRRKAG